MTTADGVSKSSPSSKIQYLHSLCSLVSCEEYDQLGTEWKWKKISGSITHHLQQNESITCEGRCWWEARAAGDFCFYPTRARPKLTARTHNFFSCDLQHLFVALFKVGVTLPTQSNSIKLKASDFCYITAQ
jgi:hypothetical protein